MSRSAASEQPRTNPGKTRLPRLRLADQTTCNNSPCHLRGGPSRARPASGKRLCSQLTASDSMLLLRSSCWTRADSRSCPGTKDLGVSGSGASLSSTSARQQPYMAATMRMLRRLPQAMCPHSHAHTHQIPMHHDAFLCLSTSPQVVRSRTSGDSPKGHAALL